MNEVSRNLHPYSFDVQPVPGKEGQWQWAIRKHGKLIQRSDRKHPSKAKAEESARGEIERMFQTRD